MVCTRPLQYIHNSIYKTLKYKFTDRDRPFLQYTVVELYSIGVNITIPLSIHLYTSTHTYRTLTRRRRGSERIGYLQRKRRKKEEREGARDGRRGQGKGRKKEEREGARDGRRGRGKGRKEGNIPARTRPIAAPTPPAWPAYAAGKQAGGGQGSSGVHVVVQLEALPDVHAELKGGRRDGVKACINQQQ